MVTMTLVKELRRHAIKRWVPCGGMDRRLKIPHSAKVDFGQLPRNAYTIAVQSIFSIGPHNTIQYNTIQYNTIQYNTIQYNTIQYNTCSTGEKFLQYEKKT